MADNVDREPRATAHRLKISKRTIDELKPGPKRFLVWDVDLPAFGCEVMPSGVKSFRLMYRPRGSGRLRNLTLGRYGSVTPDEARNRARQVLGAAAQGRDVADELAAARRQASLADAFETWLVQHVRAKRKESTLREYRRLFEIEIEPVLGRMALADITRADVTGLHRRLAAKPYIANRVVAITRAFFNWTERQGIRPANSNPARLIEMYRERKRDRLISPEELARLGEALKSEETASNDKRSKWAVAAIRLLLFTGARRSEILNLRWSDIDATNGVARLADSKTGAKTLYLSAQARAVLQTIERLPDNPHVICGRERGAPLVGLPKVWERVRKRAGLEDVRAHDLRHLSGSTGAMAGLPLLTIGRLLGHSQPSVTNRYAHFSSAPLIAAADIVADRIAEQLDGSGRKE